jgi:PAS domain S-box-containing protein
MVGVKVKKMNHPALENAAAEMSAYNKIKQAHHEWMSALDVVEDPIFLHDKDFRILRCNKAYQQCAGIPFQEIIGKPYYDVFPQTTHTANCCSFVMEKTVGATEGEEVTYRNATYRLRALSIFDAQGSYQYSVHTLENITERKLAETFLLLERNKLAAVFENVDIGLVICDEQGGDISMNAAALKFHGFASAEHMIKNIGGYADDWVLRYPNGQIMPFEEWPLPRAIRGDYVHDYDTHLRNIKTGHEWTCSYTSAPVRNEVGKIIYIAMTMLDITKRKQAETAMQHAYRALESLSAVNHNLVHATDEDELLHAICQSIVQQSGYLMAWVGYSQFDERKSIKIMAHAGHDDGYLEAMQLTWADTERGIGPCGCAIRSGSTQLCQNIANDPQYSAWHDEALKRGYAANIALPLLNADGAVFGTLSVYSNEVKAFSPDEVKLLEEMAGDLAFGVNALHIRHERDLALVKNQEQVVKLQDNLEDTVRAIATIVEMRDPYTSGHQSRVANLAAAIATQMGLLDEQVHAIHLAGVVHDVGKIQIPAEILSKPGRITDIEFSLIKVHSQAGYQILKDIAFPWPIAQMVLQHHERMDGSGYPQGLKGDAILQGARILSVADVVEAMFSHRPYRPGLGIDAALDEISRMCGKYFDPQVVGACVILFKERGYVLPR